MKGLTLAFFMLFLTTGMLGCSDTGSTSRESSSREGDRLIFSEQAKTREAWPDSRLRQAFTKYWEAGFQGRFDECYLQEADYVRQLVSREKYEKVMEFTTDAKKVTGFEVGPPRALSPYLYEIPLKAQIKTPAPGLPSPGRLDYWVKTDSGWYHAIKASLLFPEFGFPPALTGQPGSSIEGKEVRKAD